MVTLKVYTKAGTNASEVGDRHSGDGVTWGDSADRIDSEGGGIVFLTCEDRDTADYTLEQLEADADVDSVVDEGDDEEEEEEEQEPEDEEAE